MTLSTSIHLGVVTIYYVSQYSMYLLMGFLRVISMEFILTHMVCHSPKSYVEDILSFYSVASRVFGIEKYFLPFL